MKLYCKFIDDTVSASEAGYAMVCSLVPEGTAIAKTPEGKPYFPSLPDFHFSISHSKGLVVAAVSDKPIGADCERIDKIRPHALRRSFTAEEQLYAASPERFYEVWTRKEAYFKFLGTGITEDFSRFNSLSASNIASFTVKGYAVSVCGDGCNACEIIMLH